MASFNAELFRDGPGLLLRDMLRGEDDQIAAVVSVITTAAPDILALQGIDYDATGLALTELQRQLAEAGHDMPHRFAAPPNTGQATPFDMDGDGRAFRAEDAQGFGAFAGQAGMALLSRWPVDVSGILDHSALLWRDMPGAQLPRHADGRLFPTEAVYEVQRLSHTGHWSIPVDHPDGRITLLMAHPAPPVFDGDEDRNGRRNADEITLLIRMLEDTPGHVVVAGSLNADPNDGEGRKDAIGALLTHPRLQDPRPRSAGAARATDQNHRNPNAEDTVDWPPPGPGRLRVDYVLPSADWNVAGSSVVWPEDPAAPAFAASRHRLVWVDLCTAAP